MFAQAQWRANELHTNEASHAYTRLRPASTRIHMPQITADVKQQLDEALTALTQTEKRGSAIATCNASPGLHSTYRHAPPSQQHVTTVHAPPIFHRCLAFSSHANESLSVATVRHGAAAARTSEAPRHSCRRSVVRRTEAVPFRCHMSSEMPGLARHGGKLRPASAQERRTRQAAG